MKVLDVPTLSQSNDVHDRLLNEDNEDQNADVLLHPGSGSSNLWCGRASAAMIHNYFVLVEGYTRGNPETQSKSSFIKNNRDIESGEYLDLIYSNGEVAASEYILSEPLERAVEGWTRRTLFPRSKRQTSYQSPSAGSVLSETEVEETLKPILDSLQRNTPVLAYTGLSTSEARPQHIIVVCGFKVQRDGLWLKFADPSTMRDAGKGELLTASSDTSVLKIEQEGVWATGSSAGAGSLYWLKASRLFEEQQNSVPPRVDTDGDDVPDTSQLDVVNEEIRKLTAKDSLNRNDREALQDALDLQHKLQNLTSDLWLDHYGRDGLAVWIHPSHVTPPSPYASGNVIAHVPVDLGDGATALGGEAQAERLEAAYQQTEQMRRGGTFPFGFGRRWHGGVHVPSFDAAGTEGSRDPRTVRAMLPGEIVAARLGPQPDDETPNEHGSPNFILMQHDLSDVSSIPAPGDAADDAPAHPLFSLYMHLEERTALDRAQVAADTPLFERPFKASNRPLASANTGFRFYSVGTIDGRGEYDGDTWHILDLGAVMPNEHAKPFIEDARSKATPPVTDAEWAAALQTFRSHNANADGTARITPENLPRGEVACPNPQQQALWTEIVKSGFGEEDIIGPLACVLADEAFVERVGFEDRVETASTMTTIRQKTLDLDRESVQQRTLQSLGDDAPDPAMCSNSPGAFQVFEITGTGVNLRSYPSVAPDNRVDTLPAETQVTVNLDDTGSSAFDEGWVRVESRFGSGYIRRTAVEPNGWALMPDLLDAASSGGITVFDDPPHVQAGEAIWSAGRLCAHRAEVSEDAPHMDEAVHVGMFSTGEISAYRLLAESLVASYTEEKAGPNASKLFSWTEAVDEENTESFSMTFAPVQKALRDAEASHDEAEIVSGTVPDDHLLNAKSPSREAIARFFAVDDTAARMRHTAAKFVSEWTEAYPEGVKALMSSHEPFLWWETVAGDLDTLDSPHVWHYNPLFLAGLLSSPPAPPPPPEMTVESVQVTGEHRFGRETTFRARLGTAPSEDGDSEDVDDERSLTEDQRTSGVSWIAEMRRSGVEEFDTHHEETGSGAEYEMPRVDAYDRSRISEIRVTAYPVGASPEAGASVSLRSSREEREVVPAN